MHMVIMNEYIKYIFKNLINIYIREIYKIMI